METAAAVATLNRLGLSTYEARTFVALQRLGSGGAREVAEVADVPRSQVYGAAEGLAERGLVDVQQGSPTRYRPVELADARQLLLEELATEGEEAFDYLSEIRGELGGTERSEAIWITEGPDAVLDRTRQLVDGATDRVVYGGPPGELDAPVLAMLERASERGVDVHVVSSSDGTEPGLPASVTSLRVPGMSVAELPAGRTVLVDGDAVLLSVRPDEGVADVGRETAFWSEESAFARLLVAIIDGWLGSMLPDYR